MLQVSWLLPYAETSEDLTQQVVAGEFAGDLGEAELRQAQFLRQQFTGSGFHMSLRLLQVLPGAAQGIQVPAPGAEAVLPRLLKAGHALQVRAQELHAETILR